jgi:hypothetical protein
MVIYHLRIRIVKDNENWLLVFKIVSGRVSWLLDPTGKLFWPEGRKMLDHPGLGEREIYETVKPQEDDF